MPQEFWRFVEQSKPGQLRVCVLPSASKSGLPGIPLGKSAESMGKSSGNHWGNPTGNPRSKWKVIAGKIISNPWKSEEMFHWKSHVPFYIPGMIFQLTNMFLEGLEWHTTKKNWPQHLSRFFCWAIHTWKNILLLVQKSSSFSPVPKWPKIECIHENNLVDKNENTPRIVDSYITCTSLSKDVRMSMFFVLRFWWFSDGVFPSSSTLDG